MRRLVCLVLCAMLACSALAAAENAVQPSSGGTEQQLEAMLPVLDSLARALSVTAAGEDFRFSTAYDASNPELVWEQLRLMSVNWLAQDARYRTADGVSVPAGVVEDCAAASFGGARALPPIPSAGALARISYDAARDAYVFPLDAEPADYTRVECYAAADGGTVAGCGVFSRDGVYAAGERLGGMTVRLADAAAGALYPCVVTEAHAEASGDFDGLWVTLCDIRSDAVRATPAPTAVPTPVPTATPTPYATLSAGSRGEAVRALQNRLNALGYDSGRADGVFGGGTKRAVRYFQDAVGVRQDGVATPELQRRLFDAGAPRFQAYVNLRKGSSGIRVEALQERLRALGYTAAPVDGTFGERTRDAVKLFQKTAKLTVDGIAGAMTLKALDRKDARKCKDYIDLEKGDSGIRVTELQERLKALGYYTGKPSGSYDKATVKAVEAYKKDNGVKGSGKSADAKLIAGMFKTAEPTPTPTATPEPAPTGAPTDAPTEKPTEQPTEAPTEAPTEKPTEAPTEKPTEAPTEKPTEAPTEKPAEEPSDDPTDAPSEE